MTVEREAPDFWETTGATKTFTHPLDPELLAAHVPRDARVLDYGCGYGRLTAQLVRLGYRRVEGVDVSRALVARGLREHPGLALAHQPGLPLPYPGGHFGAALLFAVLTCVPGDAAQRRIVAELARLVGRGGVLYLSDMPLQQDPYHLQRYGRREGAGTYGVFRTPDGGTFRHHEPERLRELLAGHGFALAEERTDRVGTLDGHTAVRLQLVARRT